jgi:uncharacterized RDD family membrane protein YckC
VSEARVPYAGIATRAVALALDVAIAQVIVFAGGAVIALVGSLVGGLKIDTTFERILAAVAWAAVSGSYFVLFWSTAGQTPGMRLMGLRLIGADGRQLGLLRSIVRLIGLVLAIIPLFAGFIPVLVDNRRRALQDMLAHTVVLYVVEEEPLAQPAATSAPPSSATLAPNRISAGWDESLPATSASPSLNDVAPDNRSGGANPRIEPV